MQRVWSPSEVRALGVRTDLETANSVLGLNRFTGYELAKSGDYPVKVLRAGRRYIVPVAGLLAALDIPTQEEERQLTA
ncbi:DNA-binding protein [Gordonia alkanivorans]|uniref:DNA-binding protein n=1 Tax=Gordonia alkanivorans TaxID=84096 RepID=UPI002448FCB9|nr:DNA-binding protein [Gordonia alkanivorans]MDH3021541.1 DNA-binding protein [Gordonia alkanivorans]